MFLYQRLVISNEALSMRNISVVVYRSMYSVEEVAIALLWNDNNIEDVPKSKKDSSTMVVPLEQARLHIFILVMQN